MCIDVVIDLSVDKWQDATVSEVYRPYAESPLHALSTAIRIQSRFDASENDMVVDGRALPEGTRVVRGVIELSRRKTTESPRHVFDALNRDDAAFVCGMFTMRYASLTVAATAARCPVGSNRLTVHLGCYCC